MTKAKVYFSDMRTRYGGLSLPQKLGKLIEAAGIGDIDFQNKFAAIKIHFGEPGNLSFLRPNYAKVVVDTVAAQGGRPFLTDCNTLYVGRRKHALEHITAAYENGFSPYISERKCIGCGACVRICAHGAPIIENKKAHIDLDKCVGCGRCIGACPMDAVKPPADGSSMEALNKKMAEYAWAILHGRPHFHISLIVDVSPYCDCHAENDAPVVPNIGMLASFDPVALDQACADLVNAAPVMANSLLDDHLKADPEGCQGHDHFHNLTPESEWKTCLAHAEKLGMGTRAYVLVTVK